MQVRLMSGYIEAFLGREAVEYSHFEATYDFDNRMLVHLRLPDRILPSYSHVQDSNFCPVFKGIRQVRRIRGING